MKRINVIGTSGSGKSTVARNLASILDCPHVEMDIFHWKPNWKNASKKEFLSDIVESTSGLSWVLDGNYNHTQSIKWANVDTVVWVDYSWVRTLYQASKRAVIRAVMKKENWPGTGNVESFRKTFFSRDSVLLWTMKSYKDNKVYYEKIIENKEYSHINFIRLTSPRETKRFIASLAANRR
ncbi:hypothetical protein [uncultured Kiloniella sp.]|uniref:hypothetical protein n=1 Tax=uncultured Kiloniella sp. TaxID=1133091 RepID=UPI0026258BEC|nr:hypothetical protein [uncultured Kiloniella sp.]